MTKDLSFEDLLKFIRIFTLMADFGNRQQAISYAVDLLTDRLGCGEAEEWEVRRADAKAYDAMHPWVQAWT